MNERCEKLLRNLNIVKWELKNRNDSTLNLCIKYIKDSILEAEKINNELVMARAVHACCDDVDCWSED